MRCAIPLAFSFPRRSLRSQVAELKISYTDSSRCSGLLEAVIKRRFGKLLAPLVANERERSNLVSARLYPRDHSSKLAFDMYSHDFASLVLLDDKLIAANVGKPHLEYVGGSLRRVASDVERVACGPVCL